MSTVVNGNSGGNVNGTNSSRILGGTMKSTMKITEVA